MTDRAEIAAELPFVARIGAPGLAALVERVWLRLWAESGLARLADAPWFTVTRAVTRAGEGGGEGGVALVQHVRRVADVAEQLADAAEREGGAPDRDLLRAGAALIDVDKLVMSRTDEAGGPHGAAAFAQHTFYGAHVALAEGAPWPLVHLILSHSKNTGVRPRTVEAVILHYADYAVFDIRNVVQGRDQLAAQHAPHWSG